MRTTKKFHGKEATIDAGASLSDEVDTEGMSVRGMIMPAGWTTADLTFQAAHETGGTYNNVYDSQGNEVQVSAAASRAIGFTTVGMEALSAFPYLKVRSGTSGGATTQGAERTLVFVLRS